MTLGSGRLWRLDENGDPIGEPLSIVNAHIALEESHPLTRPVTITYEAICASCGWPANHCGCTGRGRYQLQLRRRS